MAEILAEEQISDISQEIVKDTHIKELKLTSKFQKNPVLHFGLDLDSAFFKQEWILKTEVTRWEETFLDTQDFLLTRNKCWLKLRENQYSLKIALGYENESLICGELLCIAAIEEYLKKYLQTELKNCTFEIGTLRCSRSQIYVDDDDHSNIYVDSCQMDEGDYYIVCAVQSPNTKVLENTMERLSLSTVLKAVPSKIIEFILFYKPELMQYTSDKNIEQLNDIFEPNRKFFHRLSDPFSALSPFANSEETRKWFKAKKIDILPSTAKEMYETPFEELEKKYEFDIASLIYYHLHSWEAPTSFKFDVDDFVKKYRTEPGACRLATLKENELEQLYCCSKLPEESKRLKQLLELYGDMRTSLATQGILW